MHRTFTRHLSLAAVVLAALACQDLPRIDRGRCGNLIVEPEAGEDCDGFGDCRAPGSVN